MNFDIIDECLDAIAKAKLEFLRIEPTETNLNDLDAANGPIWPRGGNGRTYLPLLQ